MKAVFWKELCELRIAALVVTAFGLLVGLLLKYGVHFAVGVMPLHCCLGVLIGGWQAILDRFATADAFLLHRPIAAWKIHGARSAAGLAAVLVASAASLGITLFVPWMRGHETFGVLVDPQKFPLWTDYSPGVAAFAVALAVAAWAATRLGASMGGVALAVVLVGFLPLLLGMSLASTSTDVAAVAVVTAAIASGVSLVVARQSTRLVDRSSR